MGGDSFALRAIILVAFGRVFHHCHFFGDTLIGAAIGLFVASTSFYFKIMIPSPI